MESKNVFQKLAGIPIISPPINGFIGFLLPFGIYHLVITNFVDAGNLGAGLFILLWNVPIILFCKVVYDLSLILGSLIFVFGIYELLAGSTDLPTGAVIAIMVLTVGVIGGLVLSFSSREEGDGLFDPLNDIFRIITRKGPDIDRRILSSDVEVIKRIVGKKTKFELVSIQEINEGVLVRTGWVKGHLWTLYPEDDSWTIVERQKHRRGEMVDAGTASAVDPH